MHRFFDFELFFVTRTLFTQITQCIFKGNRDFTKTAGFSSADHLLHTQLTRKV